MALYAIVVVSKLKFVMLFSPPLYCLVWLSVLLDLVEGFGAAVVIKLVVLFSILLGLEVEVVFNALLVIVVPLSILYLQYINMLNILKFYMYKKKCAFCYLHY